MSHNVSELLPVKPNSRLHIYAWRPTRPPQEYVGLIKIGQTTKSDVNKRIQQSQGQMQQDYTLLLDEFAEKYDGSNFRDTDVIRRLVEKGFENPRIGSSREWVRCTVNDVRVAIEEIRSGVALSEKRYQTFSMRPEQLNAVDSTQAYFESIWAENPERVPRFLWNAKMRFGKTFTAYQLAKRINAKKILVLTFKPAVQDAWKNDLESHVDFEGWQYRNAQRMNHYPDIDPKFPLVYFGFFRIYSEKINPLD